jgi:hypothetical protein
LIPKKGKPLFAPLKILMKPLGRVIWVTGGGSPFASNEMGINGRERYEFVSKTARGIIIV